MDKIKKAFLDMWKFYGFCVIERMFHYNKYRNPHVLAVACEMFKIYTYLTNIIGRSRLDYRQMIEKKGEWE